MSGLIAILETLRHVVAGVAAFAGVAALAAALAGQMRFPDFFTRLHGAAIVPVAAVLILAGVAIEAWDGRLAVRFAFLGLLIVVLAPLRTHLLANGAHGAGLAPLVGRPHSSGPRGREQ